MSDRESAAASPEYMNGWRWEDPRWRDWTGNDPVKLLLEALRRAVDIRDVNAQQLALEARPLILVDVLNSLSVSLKVDGSDIWDGSDLWNALDSPTRDDEAAFWKRHNQT